MKALTIRQVRAAVAGKALSPIPQDAPHVTAVCTDTRRMEKGSLFVALRCDKHNAHEFLPDAAAGGAVAALVEHPPLQTLPNVALIQVPDTRIAMGKLATYVRKQYKAKIIAVAGSNGKTSTKHLIDAALRGRLKGSISPKSFNNDIGVPLTIFPADASQDYIVLEMGTNHHGEIKGLSDMAVPDIAVITNCGAEHLEGLDDLIGVRRENAQIISGLRARGLLVVNGDDPELLSVVQDHKGKRITFGFGTHNDLFATDIVCGPSGTEFTLNNSRVRVFVPMLGRHSACNALAAIAVGRRLGVPQEEIVEGLGRSDGPEMRLQLSNTGPVTVLNDAYNANPNSMRAAIETVAGLPTSGRRIAVLGDMRELGRSSERYHREIGEFAATQGKFDLLFCVGEQSRFVAESAMKAGFPETAIRWYRDSASAATSVPRELRPDDLVLIKASRSIRLEAVANALSTSFAPSAVKMRVAS
jgi:UDP-N-acetylmuramoyl-tripeptide--D-alanyl-D-alanine ligase